jgi:hypothetical protein
MSMTREQRAQYYGDQVGRKQPSGRRLSPGSHERVEWQKGELRSVLDRLGLSDLYAIAEDALIERALKQSHKMHSENYRRAYGSTTTRKPSSRRLSGESNAEYAGRLRSLDRFTEDEIYGKAYRARRDPSKRFGELPSEAEHLARGGRPTKRSSFSDKEITAARSHSTHGKGSLRLERGAIGNALWHLPNKSPWVIYWNGPGARLLFGSNKPGSQLSPILHPTADGEYRTLKEATAAVNRFWKAKS